MSNGMGCVVPDVRGAQAAACAVLDGSSAEGSRAIVMGLDQRHLSRQGPPTLRRALLEAAQAAARRTGRPDRAYYEQAAARLGGNRACLAVARRLLKRSYHTLRELGEEALTPA